MLDDIREQRDRWQQQAERLAALAITDQRKERVSARPDPAISHIKLLHWLAARTERGWRRGLRRGAKSPGRGVGLPWEVSGVA
jgi:hypothetical protein